MSIDYLDKQDIDTHYLNRYDYVLPRNLIAQEAYKPRDACRLMVVSKGKEHDIEHKRFRDIVDYMDKGDVLVLNDTKVLAAKIYGKKSTGSDAEIVLTKRLSKDRYECHIQTKNPVLGTKMIFDDGNAVIIGQKNIDTFIVRISGAAKKYFPGPPYIMKKMGKEYQTVYAKKSGSLAAPTAGLHFTNRLLDKIKAKGVRIVYITLHVSYGTFRDVSNMEKHKMDPEYFEINENAAHAINSRTGRLIVAGTTTLKALESSSMNDRIIACKGYSRLFIKPGYGFSSGTDVLITNFHLPRSSLLLLTCAFGSNEQIMQAYTEAIRLKYMFYSLGDAMMIIRHQ